MCDISFKTEDREGVLAPHHGALVISLTVTNCLVKRVVVDSESSGNIIFQTAYQSLVLKDSILTKKVVPLVGFSGEI